MESSVSPNTALFCLILRNQVVRFDPVDPNETLLSAGYDSMFKTCVEALRLPCDFESFGNALMNEMHMQNRCEYGITAHSNVYMYFWRTHRSVVSQSVAPVCRLPSPVCRLPSVCSFVMLLWFRTVDCFCLGSFSFRHLHWIQRVSSAAAVFSGFRIAPFVSNTTLITPFVQRDCAYLGPAQRCLHQSS